MRLWVTSDRRMSSLKSIQCTGSQNEHWLHTCMCHTCIITFRFGLQASISMPSVNSNDSSCFSYRFNSSAWLFNIHKKTSIWTKGISKWCWNNIILHNLSKVELCNECIEWAMQEKRTFLRQALQVSDAVLQNQNFFLLKYM